jgi:hypothetical protein
MAEPEQVRLGKAPVACGGTPAMTQALVRALTEEFIKPESAEAAPDLALKSGEAGR